MVTQNTLSFSPTKIISDAIPIDPYYNQTPNPIQNKSKFPVYGSPRPMGRTSSQKGEQIPGSVDNFRNRYTFAMGSQPATAVSKFGTHGPLNENLMAGRQAVRISKIFLF